MKAGKEILYPSSGLALLELIVDMKKLLLLLICIQVMYTARANYIAEIRFKYRLLEGHSVTMYFAGSDLNDLYKRILSLDTINERKLLAVMGMPLDESNSSQENCIVPAELGINFQNLLYKRVVKTITCKSQEIFLQIRLLNCDYNLCTFPLMVKYWGSYDVNFKEAAVLTSEPRPKSWDRTHKKLLKQIRESISQIIERSSKRY